MSRIYDNWERLVEATLKREQLRHIALHCESFSSIASDFTFDSFSTDVDVAEGSRSEAEILSSHNAKPFSFDELKRATRNFRSENLLAEGGFCCVYKGWIDEHTLTAAEPGSGLAIAVKKLEPEAFLDHEEWLHGDGFQREVNYTGQLCHPNLVKLIGYSSDGDNEVLVYELVEKGTLENHLFGRVNQTLSWDTRIKVAIGVARALCFLHDRDLQLIHGDVKASSILLNGDFSAKLSGFTLAKVPPPWSKPLGYWSSWSRPPGIRNSPPGHWNPTPPIDPQFMGPKGYIALEYILTGELTAKCDVYSFGVVLIELLCGRRAIDPNRPSREQDLVEWARPYLVSQRKLFWIMDTKLDRQYPKKRAYAVATLALQCISADPEDRPRMTEVLGALEYLQGPIFKTGI